MSSEADERSADRLLYVLSAMFFFSGIAGLIYQVVWLRMLLRSFGVSVYAVTSVVSVFMTGLALGSYFASVPLRRFASSPLRLYGFIEVGIGLCALGSTAAIMVLPTFFAGSGAQGGALLVASRVLLSMLVLLPPTILMGATLPVLARFLAEQPARVGRHAGLLYGFNTLGAVVGVLLTGFFLIATIGEKRTVAVAMGLNILVGLACLSLDASKETTRSAETEDAPAKEEKPAEAKSLVLLAFAGQGFCALSFEVLWSRNLTILLGNSVYGFSFMLGAYLLGVALGSLLIARVIDRMKRPFLVFALLELLLGSLALISVQMFVLLGLLGASSRQTYALLWSLKDFWRLGWQALLVVMPVTLLLGMTFPVASRLAAGGAEGTEQSVGRLYAVNTVGGIAGSFLTGFVLIPVFGTQMSFVLSAALSFVVGVLLLRASVRVGEVARHRMVLLSTSFLFVLLLSVSFLDPVLVVLQARIDSSRERVLAHVEDRGVTVTMTRVGEERTLYINGLYVSNTSTDVAVAMVDFPLSFHPRTGPKRIMAVGLGVGEVLRHAIDRGHDVTIAELHPAVRSLFEQFSPTPRAYLDNPRAHINFEDGRNFLLRTNEKYDMIFVDGSPPLYASGMVNLYTVDFARLAHSRLAPGGMFVVWFPVVCFEQEFWMVVRSFAEVFPSISVLTQQNEPNAILMGSTAGAQVFDRSRAQYLERMNALPGMRAGLAEQLWQLMLRPEAALRRRSMAAPLLTDDLPLTEYPLQPFLRGEFYYDNNRFLFRRVRRAAGASAP